MKGFTLIELLIVMVIVSILVTIALPKYQRALERGRALEGLNNVRTAADYMNARYLVDGSYPTSEFELNRIKKDMIKSRYFNEPNMSAGSTVTISRKSESGWVYSFTATSNTNGEITSITCTSADDTCANLDMSGNLMTRQ